MTPEETPNTHADYRALIPALAARLVALPRDDPALELAAGVLMQAIEEYTQTPLIPIGARWGSAPAPPPDRDPLCPECQGAGYTLTPGSYYDPPEPEACPVCAGEGTLSGHAEGKTDE